MSLFISVSRRIGNESLAVWIRSDCFTACDDTSGVWWVTGAMDVEITRASVDFPFKCPEA